MRRCFFRKGSDVQPTQRYIRAARAVVIGDLVRAVGVGDVDLNDYEIRRIVELEFFDVFILQRDLQVRIEISSKRRQTKWRE